MMQDSLSYLGPRDRKPDFSRFLRAARRCSSARIKAPDADLTRIDPTEIDPLDGRDTIGRSMLNCEREPSILRFDIQSPL